MPSPRNGAVTSAFGRSATALASFRRLGREGGVLLARAARDRQVPKQTRIAHFRRADRPAFLRSIPAKRARNWQDAPRGVKLRLSGVITRTVGMTATSGRGS